MAGAAEDFLGPGLVVPEIGRRRLVFKLLERADAGIEVKDTPERPGCGR
jgi:hypothetical protein